jgi:hypothetical protein
MDMTVKLTVLVIQRSVLSTDIPTVKWVSWNFIVSYVHGIQTLEELP